MRPIERLENRAVHLWTVLLEASEDNFQRSLTWLSPEEKERAERFRFDRHRRAFALGRAALRMLLASYLGVANAQLRFVYGPQGKPALAEPSSPLRFNVSNSGSLASYVFTTGCEIGVDLEHHRPLPDIENIARRFFSPGEAAELLALGDADRTTGFFNCWTRKEAYIKAMGGGLSIPLDSFQVTLRPGEPARMVCLNGSADAARDWTLHHFTPAQDYTGAIAYSLAYPAAPRRILANPFLSFDDLMAVKEGLRTEPL